MKKSKPAQLILGNLVTAIHLLEKCPPFAALIPEVRVNLVYAIPNARSPRDVAAVEGRITTVAGRPHASGLPAWGASDHMARLILEVRRYNPSVNAGINFKCDAAIIRVVKKYCTEKGLSFGWIDRTKEPEAVAGVDRRSMPWKVKQLVERYGAVPRVFYEGDGWGKEPLFMATGKDAIEAAGIAIAIARRLKA